MSFSFKNLDDVTRQFMCQEIDTDIANRNLYLSSRLSVSGINDYPSILRQAAQSHDIAWLAEQLRSSSRLNRTETRNGKDKLIEAKVPETAADTLSEGEFNRYYMRALCRRALAEQIKNVIVYRAKEVRSPREESTAIINSLFSPEALLADLRANTGVETALGLPPGPNSGLSIRLP